jgi:hypothetical protein
METYTTGVLLQLTNNIIKDKRLYTTFLSNLLKTIIVLVLCVRHILLFIFKT